MLRNITLQYIETAFNVCANAQQLSPKVYSEIETYLRILGRDCRYKLHIYAGSNTSCIVSFGSKRKVYVSFNHAECKWSAKYSD